MDDCTETQDYDQFYGFETLESFIAREQHVHSQSRGVFSSVLRRIGLASKIVESKIRRAGLLDVVGPQGRVNVQGESQQKLDLLANEVIKAAVHWLAPVAGIASEEEEDAVCLTPRPRGEAGYCLLFDPLDGSSNIDANVSVGTIFSIHRQVTDSMRCEQEDFLQPGRKQVAAGYIVYGSSTMFVYTTGNGVHGFTLDPEVGEFVLSHHNLKMPDQCKCFSANDSNYLKWDEPTRKFADRIRYATEGRYAATSSRYIGSMVADFHRNLLYGGIFMYPADAATGAGKLRLLYECAPFAFLAEQADGAASTGTQAIMDIQPTELHQRVPIVIGNKTEVELYEEMVREHSGAQA